MTPRAVLPKCGSSEWPSARTSSLRGRDAEAGAVCGELDTVGEFNTRPRVAGEEQVAVEINVVAEACDLRGRGDPEARFDHAPEHHTEAERARRVHHPHRLP